MTDQHRYCNDCQMTWYTIIMFLQQLVADLHQPIFTLWASVRLHTDILTSAAHLLSVNNFKFQVVLFDISMQ